MNGTSKIRTCVRCLYRSDHPLGLTFDDMGICSGCRIHEEKDTLDWGSRLDELKRLIAPYKSKTGNNYDCIVPVSGGQDSHFIVHVVKNILNLNPLLVAYNKYFNTAIGIRNLANLRIKFDCDIIIKNVNPKSVKNITRHTLRKYGSIYWPILAGQTVFPVQTAVSHKIPLIIWGAHQGIEQVGMFSHLNNVEMSRRYRKDHDLFGVEADSLLDIFDNLNEEDVWQYRYPSDIEINQVGIRGIYLGNYIRWDPKQQHENMIQLYDYKTANFQRTFDRYDFVDCFNYMHLHDILKYYKCGFSKVTDHACREIRHGRLSRSDALIAVERYSNLGFNNLELFAEWLGTTINSIKFVMDMHRNPFYWKETAPQKWEYIKLEKSFQTESEVSISEKLGFLENEYKNNLINKYITVGKGYP